MVENKISTKHYIIFIYAVTFVSLKVYCSQFITIGGRDTWVCLIIAFILLIAISTYLLGIIEKRGNYSINNIFTIGLSKTFGNILLFLFAIGLFLSSLEATMVEANCIKTCFFLSTPQWYIILFFLLPSLFLISKKISTVLIFTTINVICFIANCLILNIFSEPYKNTEYILPVFGNNLTISNYFNCFLLLLGCISSFAISLPYLKHLTKADNLKKHSFIALCIIALYSIYSMIGIISCFGPSRAANLFYPEYTMSQRIKLGGFIDFGELFFLVETVIGLFLKYILSTYGIYIIYKNYIKNHKIFVAAYSIIIFILGSLLSKNNYILFNILKYYNYSNLFFFILIPLIAFTAFLMKSSKKA
ncbi:MAG: endospore germination permease [Clostridium sp.]|nr:endospore germination permease [Clostridium sp.]